MTRPSLRRLRCSLPVLSIGDPLVYPECRLDGELAETADGPQHGRLSAFKTASMPRGASAMLFGFNGRATRNFIALLVLMHFILFVDRVNLATAAPVIQQDLGLSNIAL